MARKRRSSNGLGELPVCKRTIRVTSRGEAGTSNPEWRRLAYNNVVLGYESEFLHTCFVTGSAKRQREGVYGERFPLKDYKVYATDYENPYIDYYGHQRVPRRKLGYVIEGVGVTKDEAKQHLKDIGFTAREILDYLIHLPTAHVLSERR